MVYGAVAEPKQPFHKAAPPDHIVAGRSGTTLCGRRITADWAKARGVWEAVQVHREAQARPNAWCQDCVEAET